MEIHNVTNCREHLTCVLKYVCCVTSVAHKLPHFQHTGQVYIRRHDPSGQCHDCSSLWEIQARYLLTAPHTYVCVCMCVFVCMRVSYLFTPDCSVIPLIHSN